MGVDVDGGLARADQNSAYFICSSNVCVCVALVCALCALCLSLPVFGLCLIILSSSNIPPISPHGFSHGMWQAGSFSFSYM